MVGKGKVLFLHYFSCSKCCSLTRYCFQRHRRPSSSSIRQPLARCFRGRGQSQVLAGGLQHWCGRGRGHRARSARRDSRVCGGQAAVEAVVRQSQLPTHHHCDRGLRTLSQRTASAFSLCAGRQNGKQRRQEECLRQDTSAASQKVAF